MSEQVCRLAAVLGTPDDFWGKLIPGPPLCWHPLIDHCADVAACAERLLRRTLLGRRLAQLGGKQTLDESQIQRLCVLAALHDLGKFSIGFQNRVLPRPPFQSGHTTDLVTALLNEGFLSRFRVAVDAQTLERWGESVADLLLASLSHHGTPLSNGERPYDPRCWNPTGGLDPFEGMSRLVQACRQWFPGAWGEGPPLPSAVEFQHAWSGLVTLADWIGSDADRFFPFRNAEDPPDRMVLSRELAANAVRALGIEVESWRQALGPCPEPLRLLLPESATPRPVQRELQDWCLGADDHGTGSLLILEAPTGEGKTEAALAYFVRLFQTGQVDGLYFALPTRTAARQLYARVLRAVSSVFPEQSAPQVILAVPGYLEADGVQGIRLAPFRYLWGDHDDPERAARCWAAENSKRYLAGAIAVGTVDQILLSGLTIAHAHLRSTALLRLLLVVDEVHASDAYMTRVLSTVLEYHRRAGGHSLLMSATLGASMRSQLLRRHAEEAALGTDLAKATALPYPLISRVQPDRSRRIPTALSSRRCEVEVLLRTCIGTVEEVADLALEAADAGARVLVIRNTVADCIATHSALESRCPDQRLLFRCSGLSAPHHARFARTDRMALDHAIEESFGAKAPNRGLVAVGTQTLQQSLDLDADFMVTDLCPIDVLLQRVGRLHRHSRQRPAGFRVPRVVVLVPDRPLESWLPEKGDARGPHGFGTVYPDFRMLEMTLRVLRRESVLRLPERCRILVESALHNTVLQELGASSPRWQAHQNQMTGSFLADWGLGSLNTIDYGKPFQELQFPRQQSRSIRTRLGLDDRRVHFPQPWTPCWFDASRPLDEITIPGWMLRGESAHDEFVTAIRRTSEAVRFEFLNRKFAYGRQGLSLAAGEESDDGEW